MTSGDLVCSAIPVKYTVRTFDLAIYVVNEYKYNSHLSIEIYEIKFHPE